MLIVIHIHLTHTGKAVGIGSLMDLSKIYKPRDQRSIYRTSGKASRGDARVYGSHQMIDVAYGIVEQH